MTCRRSGTSIGPQQPSDLLRPTATGVAIRDHSASGSARTPSDLEIMVFNVSLRDAHAPQKWPEATGPAPAARLRRYATTTTTQYRQLQPEDRMMVTSMRQHWLSAWLRDREHTNQRGSLSVMGLPVIQVPSRVRARWRSAYFCCCRCSGARLAARSFGGARTSGI